MESDPASPQQVPTSFGALIERGHDVFFRFRLKPSPGFDYLSPSVTELSGYPVEAFVADPGLFGSLVHPDDRGLLDADGVGISESGHLRWLRKDGAAIWVQQRSVAIAGPDGEVVAIEGVVRDVTAQNVALETIRGSERDFRALLDRIDLAAAIVDPDGRAASSAPSSW